MSSEKRQTIEDWYNSIMMGYQKMANLLNNASNQPSKFGARNWVEINGESRTYNSGAQIKIKTTMLKSSLCYYSDAYI